MAPNIVKYHVSFKMAASLSPTICKVFNGSHIGKSYASGRQKTTRMGLGCCRRNGKRVKVNFLSRNKNNES